MGVGCSDAWARLSGRAARGVPGGLQGAAGGHVGGRAGQQPAGAHRSQDAEGPRPGRGSRPQLGANLQHEVRTVPPSTIK